MPEGVSELFALLFATLPISAGSKLRTLEPEAPLKPEIPESPTRNPQLPLNIRMFGSKGRSGSRMVGREWGCRDSCDVGRGASERFGLSWVFVGIREYALQL